MGIAVKNLWDFYRDCYNNVEILEKKFMEILKKDDEIIKGITDISQKFIYISNTLDHYRRIVTQYYDYMVYCFENKIIPKSFIHELLTERDLEIIPNILIPMDYVNAIYVGRKFKDKHHFISKEPSIRKKLKLYKDSKDYFLK